MGEKQNRDYAIIAVAVCSASSLSSHLYPPQFTLFWKIDGIGWGYF
jgi:hypothetical protein